MMKESDIQLLGRKTVFMLHFLNACFLCGSWALGARLMMSMGDGWRYWVVGCASGWLIFRCMCSMSLKKDQILMARVAAIQSTWDKKDTGYWVNHYRTLRRNVYYLVIPYNLVSTFFVARGVQWFFYTFRNQVVFLDWIVAVPFLIVFTLQHFLVYRYYDCVCCKCKILLSK